MPAPSSHRPWRGHEPRRRSDGGALRAPDRRGPRPRDRDRDPTAVLDRARGRCRLRPGGLRGRAHTGRWGIRGRPGDRRGAGAGPVAGRPAARRGSRCGCACGSAGRGCESDWSDPATVEAGLLGTEDWTARFVSPRELGGLGAPAPVLRLGPGRARRGRAGPALRHGARPVRGQAQRATCRRRGARARLDELRAPAALPDLRRHRPGPRGRQRPRGAARQRLVSRPARLPRPARPVRRPARRCSPSSRSTTADGAVHVLATDELVDRPRERCPGRRPLRRPADRPARLASRRPQRTPSRSSTRTWLAWSRPTARRCGSPQTVPAAADVSPRRPARRSSTSGRTSSAGCGSGSADQPPGHEVVIRHAEVLEDGELGVRPLRTAKATDTYVLAGGPLEVLEPSLTFHGFRYAEVSGLSADLAPRTSRPSSSAPTCGGPAGSAPRTSSSTGSTRTSCGAMRGNFVDVPTDCPATRRAARLDRRHPGLRARRRASCSTARAS